MPVLFASGAWGCGLGAIAWGKGDVVHGRLSNAGPACCLTSSTLVSQVLQGDDWLVMSVALVGGKLTQLSTKGANSLYGNAGLWAAFYGGAMRIGNNVGETGQFPNAAPVDVARDGRIGYKPDHKTGAGLNILHTDGSSVTISNTLARDVAVVPGRDAAIWATARGLGAAGIACVSVDRPTAKPRAILVSGVPWFLYQFSFPGTQGNGGRLVFHPYNSLTGYVLTESKTRLLAFRPDAIQQGQETVSVIWARTEGEAVESLEQRTILLTDKRVDVSKWDGPTPPEPPMPEPIPNHLDTVKVQRAKYNHLSGEERAYHVVNGTAWELRSEGAGMFYKPSGTGYEDRSIDILIYKHREGDPTGKGATFDILGDAEGKANPQWSRTSPSGYGDVKNWRAPIDPGGEPEPPEPPTPEPDPDSIKARLEEVQRSMVVDLERLNGIINDL